MGARHDWANWLCSINVEMYCLSALTLNPSVNNLSVILGRFMNFWREPILCRTYKVYSERAQHISPSESRTSGPSDTALGYVKTIQVTRNP